MEAIYEACILRFRPIMMTTMAALLGGLPLALSSGTGSELHRPLGITIVGGLAVSQMLTLFTTPVVYVYLDRLRLWLRGGEDRFFHRPRQRRAAAQPGTLNAPCPVSSGQRIAAPLLADSLLRDQVDYTRWLRATSPEFLHRTSLGLRWRKRPLIFRIEIFSRGGYGC